ncbi:MAG: ChbG/HpnK family deacetylase, partial [Solirubrobacteraceae bacterium]
MSGRGLLIVNGDDWGASVTTTDAMLRCVEAGAVTSVSAMVHMADSHRAAELARGTDLPTG